MRIPTDAVESLNALASIRGLAGYQTLLKSYISDGPRRDEAQFDQYTAQNFVGALRRRGVGEGLLKAALEEVRYAGQRVSDQGVNVRSGR